eukprot:813-Amphidinium_carterae.1
MSMLNETQVQIKALTKSLGPSNSDAWLTAEQQQQQQQLEELAELEQQLDSVRRGIAAGAAIGTQATSLSRSVRPVVVYGAPAGLRSIRPAAAAGDPKMPMALEALAQSAAQIEQQLDSMRRSIAA